jgi:hypothetical protein|tara:strand:- start:401 stop:1753 length:1353 start_codon:yes stop_codon:yes gene_type:complete
MATYNNPGPLKFGDPGAVIDSVIPSRRLYNFSDRVADLAPEESPFFVYLSKVAKVPTDDPQFRWLKDRNKIQMSERSFALDASHTVAAAGSSITYTVDDGAGASVDWLIKGMVFTVGETNSSTNEPETAIVRIESSPVDTGTETTFTGKTISAATGSTTAGADGDKCTVIGTAFEEGSGSPDSWSRELDNGSGYCQIFKTACELTNTARATVYRGYASEWDRIWNLKLREHKVDIERAMLFGHSASQSGINYTDGIVGHIVKNSQSQIKDNAVLTYTEDKGYFSTRADDQMTYDALLADLEVVFDPARGGSKAKLALCSLPVVTYFNKLGSSNTFLSSAYHASHPMFAQEKGSYGHKVMKVETIHGDLTLVKEPLFRGFASPYMCLVDLDNVAYRPLIGNGVNRDTHIMTNVQSADEDLRKDMILTEAGLEVSLPEAHALFNFESNYTSG